MVLSKNFSLLRHPLMYASGDKSPMKTTYARIALTDKNTMHSVSLMHRFNLLFKNLVFCKQALLSVVGAASILLGISSTLYAETTPRVNSGVVDLQNWNFDTGGMVPLSGDYGFFGTSYLKHGSSLPTILRFPLHGRTRKRREAESMQQTVMRHIRCEFYFLKIMRRFQSI